jgi:pSer/pThr/pTyr-binding forkhead associated (FHA) protein
MGGNWELYESNEGWQLRGSGTAPTVNNSDYQPGQILACGDTITTGSGQDALLIEVNH